MAKPKTNPKRKKPNCRSGKSFACGFSCQPIERNGKKVKCRSNVNEKGVKIVEDYTEFLRRTTGQINEIPNTDSDSLYSTDQAFKTSLLQGIQSKDAKEIGSHVFEEVNKREQDPTRGDSMALDPSGMTTMGLSFDESGNISTLRPATQPEEINKAIGFSAIRKSLYGEGAPESGPDPLKTLYETWGLDIEKNESLGALEEIKDVIPEGFVVLAQQRRGKKKSKPFEGFGDVGVSENGRMRIIGAVRTKEGFRPFQESDKIPNAKQKATSIAERSAFSNTMEAIANFLNEDIKGINDPAWHAEEDEFFAKQDALEREGWGRPEKTGRFTKEALIQASKDWAKEQGFDQSVGVNGFTADQTAAHDVSHPATHALTGLNTKDMKDVFGDNLAFEEGVVNMIEHLSRGDDINASILNAVRLTKVLLRGDRNSPEYKMASSPEFTNALAKMAYRAMSHSDYEDIMKVVRDSNRLSGTVTTSGFDFGSTATGG